MINDHVLNCFPLIQDLKDQYVYFRMQGCSPEDARGQLMKTYAKELEDYDESLIVLSGIALAQWGVSELEESSKQNIMTLLENRIAETEENGEKRALNAILKSISTEQPKKKCMIRPGKSSYSLNWSIGDTFAHKLTHPDAEKAGILGWYLLFRKVGQYTDWKGKTIQLGYVTFCDDQSLPKTTEDLNKLGFLRVMARGKKWEYMVQVDIQSKRMENTLKFDWIGCFPDAVTPIDEASVDPRVTMPFYEGTEKIHNCPRYEDYYCYLYSKYGIGGI